MKGFRGDSLVNCIRLNYNPYDKTIWTLRMTLVRWMLVMFCCWSAPSLGASPLVVRVVGLNRGLIGHRILMIRPEDQELFDGVTDLDSFRALGLRVGFGRGWIDSLVWAANDLRYYEEPGAWHVMFDKLARGRGDFDYLSRSVKEIGDELAQQPALVAEQNLVLVYDRDEAFYVSSRRPDIHRILTDSMRLLDSNGRLQQLVDAYWGDVLDAVDFDSRRTIELITP